MLSLLEAARSMPGMPAIEYRNHQRRVKKRAVPPSIHGARTTGGLPLMDGPRPIRGIHEL
jgi:hypothetical protein